MLTIFLNVIFAARKQDQAGARLLTCIILILYNNNISDIAIALKKIKIGFFECTGNLKTFTLFLSIYLSNSPPLVAIKDLQPFSGRKWAKS